MRPRPRRDAPITRHEREAAHLLVRARRAEHAATLAAIREEARDIGLTADALRHAIEARTDR